MHYGNDAVFTYLAWGGNKTSFFFNTKYYFYKNIGIFAFVILCVSHIKCLSD